MTHEFAALAGRCAKCGAWKSWPDAYVQVKGGFGDALNKDGLCRMCVGKPLDKLEKSR